MFSLLSVLVYAQYSRGKGGLARYRILYLMQSTRILSQLILGNTSVYRKTMMASSLPRAFLFWCSVNSNLSTLSNWASDKSICLECESLVQLLIPSVVRLQIPMAGM